LPSCLRSHPHGALRETDLDPGLRISVETAVVHSSSLSSDALEVPREIDRAMIMDRDERVLITLPKTEM
jgi:hypothetical protein